MPSLHTGEHPMADLFPDGYALLVGAGASAYAP